MSSPKPVQIETTINAPIKEVFEAWLNPEAMQKFMCPAEGMSVAKTEADPKVGGQFLVVMQVGDEQWPHRGEYKLIDRYRELQFTWLSNYTAPDSLVTLKLEELSERSTKISLHHEGFIHQESRDNHEGGWGRILEVLGKFLT